MAKANLDYSNIHLWFSRCKWAPCCWRLEAIYNDCPTPIGTIFFTRMVSTVRGKNGKQKSVCTVTILNSDIMKRYRRQGLRTYIQKELKNWGDIFKSGADTKAGHNWMLKNGYKIDRVFNEYFYIK